MKRTQAESGFTLMELIISLTILAILVALVFGGFRLGIRAWEKGEQAVETVQRERALVNLVASQLAALSIPLNGPRERFELVGSKQDLIFLCRHSLFPGREPYRRVVRYRIDEGDAGLRLLYHELDANQDVNGINTSDTISEDAFTPLMEGLTAVHFDYLEARLDRLLQQKDLEKSGNAPNWQDNWPSIRTPPAAIRFTIQTHTQERPLCVIVPIRRG